MKTAYDRINQNYSVDGHFSSDFKLPKGATLEQLSIFDEKVASIQITPMESIELAYMDAFGVELDDDSGVEIDGESGVEIDGDFPVEDHPST